MIGSLAFLGPFLLAARAEEPGLPWKPSTPHRFVWVQGGHRVGETQMTLEPAVENGKPIPGYIVTSSRKYDKEGISQRAKGTTLLRPDLTPVRFEESLEFSGLTGARANQRTELTFASGKVKVLFVQNEKEQPPRELEVPEGALLIASQAVEHWALFTSRFPGSPEKHEVRLFYPDFAEVLRVTFLRAGSEKLRIG
ncbi:MAG: hypothetical protein HY721_17630, partial [Planctomycetes bacterium]|nr:hypothetical protein [Planctomycetota bacterium]